MEMNCGQTIQGGASEYPRSLKNIPVYGLLVDNDNISCVGGKQNMKKIHILS